MPHRRKIVKAVPAPPEIDESKLLLPELDDEDPDAVREASMLLGVPEWVDPETGELADDELTRFEDH